MTEQEETAKILYFPPERIKRLPPKKSIEEVFEEYGKEEVEKLKAFNHVIIRSHLAHMVPIVFNLLAISGFNVSSIQQSKNAGMIVESIKAFIERQMGVDHPFHVLAENLFEFDEEGHLIMNDMKTEEGENTNEGSNVSDTGERLQTENQIGESGTSEEIQLGTTPKDPPENGV